MKRIYTKPESRNYRFHAQLLSGSGNTENPGGSQSGGHEEGGSKAFNYSLGFEDD